MKKALLLIIAILVGAMIPSASTFSYLIYYLLMFMLFFPFLEWKMTGKMFLEKKIYILLSLNLLIGLISYFLLQRHNSDLAIAAFLVGIAPTATACPAIISYLKGKVDISIAAVLITNLFMSVLIPLIILLILKINVEIGAMLIKTLVLLILPLLLSQLISKFFPKTNKNILKFKHLGFYAWLLVCFLAMAKASEFIQSSGVGIKTIITISVVSGILCLINFNVGKFIGGKTSQLEMSQSLGQKNTMLVIWISLTYFNPLVTLGPISYLVWHNLYNAYQLAFYKK